MTEEQAESAKRLIETAVMMFGGITLIFIFIAVSVGCVVLLWSLVTSEKKKAQGKSDLRPKE